VEINIKKLKTLLAPILLILFVLVNTPTANASIIDNIKNLLNPSPKELNLTSNIALAKNGDLDKNQEVNTGDIVTFSFIITNPSEKKYSSTTLKTNIDRQSINFIHNIIGTSGLNDNGKTITIPNIKVNPNESITISFDARLNYFDESSKTLGTEAELISLDKKSLFKDSKKQINTKKSKSQAPATTKNNKNK
jgi:hypothetical protein